MFHRTIYLKYRQDVTQADASALLHTLFTISPIRCRAGQRLDPPYAGRF